LLESLYAGALEDARKRQEHVPLPIVERQAREAPAALDALDFLKSGQNITVIAEIKRASPSKGHLADISDPAALAQEYETAGASAISVLTEQRSFLGSLEDLGAVRPAVTIPVLRKDFIATEYQVLEARANGADIVLLIAAGLTREQLIRLKSFTESLGMCAFVETHNLEEVKFVSSIGAQLVGINARDLSTFETDRSLFEKLVDELPGDCIKVAESAVRSSADVAAYAAAGAQCVLVGEALVTGDAKALLQAFTQIPKV
jgi:indole-3-glycerol phosphate synthase